MLCQNCGENEANVRYTQIINGVKKEMALCKKCSKELDIGNMDFSMPISFSSFLTDFFEEEKEFLPSFIEQEKLMCNKCSMTYEDFIDTGKFGCENCYEIFSNKIDPILKNIHKGNRHIGRGIPFNKNEKVKDNSKELLCNSNHCSSGKEKNIEEHINTKDKQLEKLKKDLKQAIQEERYEDAAKLRDKVREMEEK